MTNKGQAGDNLILARQVRRAERVRPDEPSLTEDGTSRHLGLAPGGRTRGRL